jgi:hypothetical protein
MLCNMKSLTKHDVLAAREVRYRRRLNLRVLNQQQAVEFVNDVGFSFLFPIQKIELPSLWDAIAGRVVKTYPDHKGYEIERTWGWKDEALDKKWWYYGKLIRNKATLVSLDFLPNFYALSENFGDYEHDYLEEYETGQLTSEARQVYEALLKNGALDAVRLRREAHLSTDANKGRFDKALTDLQTGLKVLPAGIAPAGAWHYAFIYEILPRWLPQIPLRAQQIGRVEARRRILDQYLRNVMFSTVPIAARLFRWTLAETQQAADALAADGHLELNVKVSGIKDLQMVTHG